MWSSGSFQVRACIIHFLCLCLSVCISFTFSVEISRFEVRTFISVHLHCNAFHAVVTTLRKQTLHCHARKRNCMCSLVGVHFNFFPLNWKVRIAYLLTRGTLRYNDPHAFYRQTISRWKHIFCSFFFWFFCKNLFLFSRDPFYSNLCSVDVSSTSFHRLNSRQLMNISMPVMRASFNLICISFTWNKMANEFLLNIIWLWLILKRWP